MQAKAVHDELLKPEHGGHAPPTNWYKVMVRKLNNAEEAECAKSLRPITQPVLLITAAQDRICLPAIQEAITRPHAADLRVESLDCAHWVQLERPGETNELLRRFFGEVVGKGGK